MHTPHAKPWSQLIDRGQCPQPPPSPRDPSTRRPSPQTRTLRSRRCSGSHLPRPPLPGPPRGAPPLGLGGTRQRARGQILRCRLLWGTASPAVPPRGSSVLRCPLPPRACPPWRPKPTQTQNRRWAGRAGRAGRGERNSGTDDSVACMPLHPTPAPGRSIRCHRITITITITITAPLRSRGAKQPRGDTGNRCREITPTHPPPGGTLRACSRRRVPHSAQRWVVRRPIRVTARPGSVTALSCCLSCHWTEE